MLHQSFSPDFQSRITVLQGEARVSTDPGDMFTTVLGSCVATCLFDPVARVGGMNHFLLAEPQSSTAHSGTDEDYGVYLMELLVNEMLSKGARKHNLRAHLYGGANVNRNMMKIGSMNADFAREFLRREGIMLLREDLGGTQARRVDFRPASGQVRLRTVEDRFAPPVKPTQSPVVTRGDVELF